MNHHRAFTVKDICAALDGVSRSRVHVWGQLPPFSAIPTYERSARRFSKADLLTFAALRTFEDRFGARNAQLAKICEAIHLYLSAPRHPVIDEWIFVPLCGGPARPVQAQPLAEMGWVIDMARERERIDLYLGVIPPQRELPLMAGAHPAAP